MPSNTNTTKNEEVRSENDQSSNAQQPSSPKLECISPRTVAAALAAASDIAAASASKSVLRKKDKKWVPDDHYSRLMDMNDIPRDPIEWNSTQVIMWINWACKQFRIEGLKSEKLFNMPGSSMFALTADDWRRLVPDANVNFLTHLELLKRCRGVCVPYSPQRQRDDKLRRHTFKSSFFRSTNLTGSNQSWSWNRTGVSFSPSYSGALIACDGNDTNSRKGPFILTQNNGGNYISQRILYYDATTAGQVELWRFLLELLTDWRYREYIYWVSDDGEFKLSNPEEVASMWGHRKNKPAMNWEKLSRALRYYYDGDMISKIHGKRRVYKFECDLKELLGFSAGEIYTLVKNCVEKHFLANKKRRLTSVGYDSGISHNPLSVCRDEDESLVPVRVEHGHRVSFLEPSMQQQNLDLQYRPGATSSDPLSYSVPFSPNYRIRQLNKTENDRRNRLSETTMFSDPSICERCFFKRKRSGVDVQLQVDTATDVDKIVIDEGCIDRNACNNTEDWENDDPRGGRSACRLRCRCWRRSRKPLSDISPLASPPSHLFHPINERLSSSILQEQDESTYWFTECSGDRNTQLNESYFPVDEDWVAATALIEEMMVKGSYVNSASASVSSSFHSTINPLDCTTSTCASVNVSDIDEDEIASKAEFLLREIGEHGTESTPFSFDLSPI